MVSDEWSYDCRTAEQVIFRFRSMEDAVLFRLTWDDDLCDL